MIHIQRVRHRPKVLIDLERTGAMRRSQNSYSTHFGEYGHKAGLKRL
jgi:hypothetical protein